MNKPNLFRTAASLAVLCAIGSTSQAADRQTIPDNDYWWPNRLSLEPLRQSSASADPMGAAFKYKEAVQKLDVAALNADLKKIAESLGIVYIDQLPVVCTQDRQSCTVIDSKNQLLYSDYGHWSLEGADFFGERMADMRLLDPILKP